MAKTIKFNLICDEKPVRTIEDLQNNFSIEDVLEYYRNHLLHRWLQVRGYEEQLEKVNSIESTNSMEIIKELIQIFEVITDEKKIEESIYMLQFLEERKELLSIYEQENYKAKSVIDDYEAGYKQLVDGIIENPDDVAIIKANITEIVANYSWILRLNHRDLYWTLREKSMMAIMCLLMNAESRNYYLPVEIIDEEGESSRDIDEDEYDDKKDMFNDICWMIQGDDFEEEMGENLTVFSGVTDGYWKDLEPKGKKYMIISMGKGDYVRSAGHSGGDLSSADVTNEFVIVDGVDYKSNSDTRKLLYMEV